jgi:DNA-directed RNA polymerase subunit H (RpoH/RPB5)
MSSSVSSRILRIYKSRTVILEQLSERDYAIEDYEGFSMNEIDAMLANSQLDMLINHKTDGTKVYIKYYFTLKQTSKQMNKKILDEVIEDLYSIEDVLTKRDTLIIIIDDEPNETILDRIRYLYDHDGIFVIIHNVQRLQTNILRHVLVPHMKILDEVDVENLMKTFNLKSTAQLPEISRFDPQALVMGLRPGQVAQIERESQTALFYDYYRVCV